MKSPAEKQESVPAVTSKDLVKLRGKAALRAVLESPTPATLVQSLAEEDLYWLVKDIGVQDALPILSLASNDQWQYLLDLELWTKDHLEADAVDRWMGLLMKAAPERFVIWGLSDHVELFELHLLRHIDVKIREHDESPSDFADEYFTIDGTFYIRIKEEKYEKTIRELLQRLADHDHEQYQKILFELAGLLPAEMEDEIYRLRNLRIAEKGFLPFEEAIGIYQYLNPTSLREKEHEPERATRRDQPLEEAVPVTMSTLIRARDLFYSALQQIEDIPFTERLQREFAAMCNQIICADSLSVKDKEALAAIVGKACGYLSIGIDQVVGKDLEEALRLVQKFPLQEIFRVGFGAALELRWKTEKWLKESWFHKQGFSFAFWGDEWAGMLEGLLKKRPLLYTSFSGEGPYREFKTLADITRCQQALDDIAAIDEVLMLMFAKTPMERLDRAYHPVSYQNLLLTCWARHQLDLPDKFQPITEKALETFFLKLWGRGEQPYRVSKGMREAFWLWVKERSGLPPALIQRGTGRTLEGLLAELEEEYSTVSAKDLDAKYVKHFLVEPRVRD